MFDWVRFLTQNNIDYTTASRYHVTAGNIGICCPWCVGDTGYNLHVSLRGRGWHCFRIESHKGVTPQPLIQKLLNCPFAYADTLVQEVEELPGDHDMMDRLHAMFNPPEEERMPPRQTLRLPDTFNMIKRPISASAVMFTSYLERRGFKIPDIPELCLRFNLRGCTDGSRWHGRIIFPVTLHGKLVTWTGRHVGASPIRYLTLSVNDTDTPALSTIKHTILWYDMLREQNGGTLVVCEGPFDALKVNYLGQSKQVFATSIFGKSLTEEQLELLASLGNFDKRLLLLDSGTTDHFNPRGNFAGLESAGFSLVSLPRFIKDPGEFTEESFADFLR